MAVYQIYKMMFNRSRQGNLLSKMDGKSAYDKAQDLLEQILKDKLPLTKEKRDRSLVPLDNYVEKNRNNVTVMVVCNDKTHKYKEKLEEHELEYHPGCRVIWDNTPGVCQIAIERTSSFDNNTSKVRELLENALNKCFDVYGLSVEIRVKKRESSFWEVIDEQVQKYDDPIEFVKYEFPHEGEVGPIDASSDMISKLNILQSLNVQMNAARGVYQAYSSKERQIKLNRTHEDIAHMVSMCCRNGYTISVGFKRYGIFRFGDKIIALSKLDDDIIKEFISGQTVIGKSKEGEWGLVQWLEDIRKVTENYIDEEPTQKKRKTRYTHLPAEESDLERAAESVQTV